MTTARTTRMDHTVVRFNSALLGVTVAAKTSEPVQPLFLSVRQIDHEPRLPQLPF
jgi:hypothetical protein